MEDSSEQKPITLPSQEQVLQNATLLKKVDQVLEKSKEMLNEKKFYEHLSNKKIECAIHLLVESSKELLIQQQLEEGIDLSHFFLDILQKNPDFINPQTKSQILSIFSVIPQYKKKIQYINKVLRQIYKQGDNEIFQQVGVSLMNEEKFYLAQKYLIHISDDNITISLLQRWTEKLQPIEKEYVIVRYALMKLAGGQINESQSIYNTFKKTTPLLNFLGFLIRAAKLKSQDAYENLMTKYESILAKDPTFSTILKNIACKYFGYRQNKEENMFSKLFNIVLN